LINNFDKNYTDKSQKKSYIIVNKNNVILDGVHRASVLKYIGSEIVECLQIQ